MKKTLLFVITMVCSIAAMSAALPKPIADQQLLRRTTEDPHVRRFITPTRVVWHSETGVENAKGLLEVRDGQSTLETMNPVILCSTGDQKPGILLDFGVQLNGGVQIVAFQRPENRPVRVRIRFGESVSEAMSELGGEQNATNDHAIRDQTTLIPWLGTAEIGNTGFRFVRIDLDEPDSALYLKSIRAVFVYRDIEYKGSFYSNDERLNKIWDVGAYTVHLNMQEYLWDGIKRDRLVWVGDMHPETMAIFAAFGAHEIVPKSLDMIRDVTPLPKWMNRISSYSMWWLLIHHDYYQYTGDKEYLEQQKTYMTELLKQLVRQVGKDGRESLPEIRFLDWPTRANEKAVHAGLQALLILTLEKGAVLCDILGDAATKKSCCEAARKLRIHVPDPANSKQAAALMALAGLEDAVKLNKDVMAVDGPKRMSTFYGYYVLQARAQAGDYQGCLDTIRQYWGGMLDIGATTFWEDFDLEWTNNAAPIDELVPPGKKDIHGDFGNYCYKGFRNSLCHGWSAGPTAWMSEHVLGIKIVEPGCRTIKIEPNLGDLEWVEGTYPTPHGIINVRHDKQPDGSIRTKVNAPDGVRVLK